MNGVTNGLFNSGHLTLPYSSVTINLFTWGNLSRTLRSNLWGRSGSHLHAVLIMMFTRPVLFFVCFFAQAFIEPLLCARHHARLRGPSGKQNKHSLCPQGPYSGWGQEEIVVEVGNRTGSKEIIMQISLYWITKHDKWFEWELEGAWE